MASVALQTSPPPAGKSSWRCAVVTDSAALEQLFPAWEELWKSCADADVFVSPGWARAWWKVYGRDMSLCIPTVWQGDRLVAVWPLVRTERKIKFLGEAASDYHDVLCAEKAAEHAMPLLLDAVRELAKNTVCVLDNVSANSQLLRLLELHVPNWQKHIQMLVRSEYPCVVDKGENASTFDELMHKSCLHRPNNKFTKSGKACFRHLESRDEARQHLSYFFDEHVQRRVLMGDDSRFLESELREFLNNLLDELDLKREMRFAVLELNGAAVAHSIGFKAGPRFHMYQQAFNVDFWKLSPGDVLLRWLFNYAKQAGVKEYDFGRGKEAYKDRFANDRTRTYVLYLDPSGLRHILRRWLRKVENAMRTAIRRQPAVLRMTRATRDFVWSKLARNPETHGDESGEVGEPSGEAAGKCIEFAPGDPAKLGGDTEPCTADVISAKMSDLAKLLLDFPGVLNPSTVRAYRERLRTGKKLLIRRDLTRGFQFAWIGESSATSGDDGQSHKPCALLVYDVATFPAGQPLSRELLRACMAEAARTGATLRVSCAASDVVMQRALTEASFRRFDHMA